ncbi:hypothetical protein D3C71_1630070 [compost metagenome]
MVGCSGPLDIPPQNHTSSPHPTHPQTSHADHADHPATQPLSHSATQPIDQSTNRPIDQARFNSRTKAPLSPSIRPRHHVGAGRLTPCRDRWAPWMAPNEPPWMGSRRVPAGGKPAGPHGTTNSKEASSALCALRFNASTLQRFKKTTTHKKTRPKPGFFVEANHPAIAEATA